jgi:hypothetical protein
MPSCKEEALAISRTVIPEGSGVGVPQKAIGIDPAPASASGIARAVVRSVGMVALAAFGILVLLPAALAAQAAVAL